jgi:hypothetical protein
VAILNGQSKYIKFLTAMMQDTTKFSKSKIDKMFKLGYSLAFENGRKKKNWEEIFLL